MLSSFYIKNFRSILELKLDFSYGEGKAPNGYKDQEIMPFIEATNKQRLIPCMAFFGANASGKTNILKAFGGLEVLIRDGVELSNVYDPHLLNPKFSDSTFVLEFIIANDLFEYRMTYSANEITAESLSKNWKPIYTIKNLKAEFSPQIRSAT